MADKLEPQRTGDHRCPPLPSHVALTDSVAKGDVLCMGTTRGLCKARRRGSPYLLPDCRLVLVVSEICAGNTVLEGRTDTTGKSLNPLVLLLLLTSCVRPLCIAKSLLKSAKELLLPSLPTAPACEGLALLRGTPAALAEFNG